MENDKNILVKDNNLGQSKSGFNIKLFCDDTHFSFISKKTQKIASAVYLLTSVLDNSDPIKWEVRKIVVAAVSKTIALKDKSPLLYKKAVGEIKNDIYNVISLLEISGSAGFISEMNLAIISREFTTLITHLNERHLSDEKDMLPEGFFGPINPPVGVLKKEKSSVHPTMSVSDIGQKGSEYDGTGVWRHGQGLLSVVHSNQKDNQQHGHSNKDKKSSRRGLILSLFNSKSEIDIKDVSAVLQGCGKKTLQRELLALVAEGVLKKDGEKRWSKYRMV